MGFLDRIRRYKCEEVERLRPEAFGERSRPLLCPVDSLRERPVIAEVKRASPSAGSIRDVDPVEQALRYQQGGAGAVSVLTDERFFSGGWDCLRAVSDVVEVPVLCKEFILSEKQIEVAYRCGADFVLLIAGFVDEGRLCELTRFALDMGMGVLLEVFSKEYLHVAISFGDSVMVGVNSRNLQDLSVDLSRAASMLSKVPEDRFKVAESGIRSLKDVEFMIASGADALLIGEFLMRAEDPVELLGRINALCKDMRRKGS